LHGVAPRSYAVWVRSVIAASFCALGCAARLQATDLASELSAPPWSAPAAVAPPRYREVVRIGAAPEALPLVETSPATGPTVNLSPAPSRARRVTARPWVSSGPPLVVSERLAVVPLPSGSGGSRGGAAPGALVPLPLPRAQVVVPQASTGVLDVAAAQAYDSALSLVRGDRCHDALNAFASFLARWPDHPHADNAMYWRGECFLRLGETRQGIDEFDALVRRYPSGNKVPDALYKLFATWRRMGDEARSSAAATRLLQDFPGSDAARRAQAERQMR
jgi:tol-pal system protein YbgF